METENRMVVPMPSDSLQQQEPIECTVAVPIGPREAIAVIARAAESSEAAWQFLDAYVDGYLGSGWEMVDGTPTGGGVQVTCRRKNG